MKEHLFQAVETQRAALTAMADSIFDDPELGFQEFHAQKKLTDYLTQNGFQVETGTAEVTKHTRFLSFRLSYQM